MPVAVVVEEGEDQFLRTGTIGVPAMQLAHAGGIVVGVVGGGVTDDALQERA